MKKSNILIIAILFLSLKLNAQTSNQGLYFDGVGKRVTVNDNAAYDLGTSNFTFEAWIRMNTVQSTNSPVVFSSREQANGNTGLKIYFTTSGKLILALGGGLYIPGSPQIDLRDSICHHIAVVRNDTTLYSYIDGTLYGTNTGVYQSINSTGNGFIGIDAYPSPSGGFKGLIHEVRFWNIPRTPSQIQAAKDIFLNGNETGLIGYWRMNDGTGQTVNDLSTINNDGFLGQNAGADSFDPVYQAPACWCASGPAAVITPGGPTTFCQGSNVTLTANTGTGLTYQWKLNGNNISGATSQNYVASQAGNYTVLVTNTSGCNTLSAIVAVTVLSGPTAAITANGTTTLCFNDTVILSATTGAGYTYQWLRNGVNISGATLSLYTVSSQYLFDPNGSYTCQVTSGACSAISNTIAVTHTVGVDLPAITITSSSNIICSAYRTITAPSGYIKYRWERNGVIVAITAANTYNAVQGGYYDCWAFGANCSKASSNLLQLYSSNTISIVVPPNCSSPGAQLNVSDYPPGSLFQWQRYGIDIYNERNNYLNATTAGEYSCIIQTSCGLKQSNTITISGPASIAALGSTTFCTGGVDLKATPNATSYQWNLNGSVIPGATSQLYHAPSGGSYTCTLTTPICGTGTSAAINAVANTPPSPVLTFNVPVPNVPGPNPIYNICNNPPVNVIVNPLSDGTIFPLYDWKVNNTNIPSMTNYITANSVGSYQCEVHYSCGSSFSNIIGVNDFPATDFPIFHYVTSGCSGSVNLDAGLGFISYQWKLNGAAINGQTWHTYNPTVTGNYSCLVSNGCASQETLPLTITIYAPPSATITPGGLVTFCLPGNVLLSANTGSGQTYQWKKNGTDIMGATASTYTANSSGSYTVVVTNPCSSSTSAPVTVTVILNPTASIIPTGPPTFCTGGNVILNANSGTGLTYQWKKDGNNISGATGQDYTASSAGSYAVVVSNPCFSVTSSAVSVTVNSLPSATITPSGPTTFCSGASVILNAPVAANSTCQWKKGANLIAGATLSSYTATTGGNYKVIVTNTVTGCFKTTASPTVVTVNALPSATITPQGPTTFCAGGSVVLAANTGAGLTYKWKKGSNFISGATLSNYTATTGGNYKVQITNSNGCSKTSAGVTVTVPCKEGESLVSANDFDVKVFPNPSSGDFIFEIQNSGAEKILINVYDMIGKMVLSKSAFGSRFIIHNSQVAPGIYNAEIINGESKKIVKLVKTKEY